MTLVRNGKRKILNKVYTDENGTLVPDTWVNPPCLLSVDENFDIGFCGQY